MDVVTGPLRQETARHKHIHLDTQRLAHAVRALILTLLVGGEVFHSLPAWLAKLILFPKVVKGPGARQQDCRKALALSLCLVVRISLLSAGGAPYRSDCQAWDNPF